MQAAQLPEQMMKTTTLRSASLAPSSASEKTAARAYIDNKYDISPAHPYIGNERVTLLQLAHIGNERVTLNIFSAPM